MKRADELALLGSATHHTASRPARPPPCAVQHRLFTMRFRQDHTLSVAQLNRAVRLGLEHEFGDVLVVGEISDLTRAASCRLYFTLNDEAESAQVRVVMFKSDVRRSRATFESGARLCVRGGLTLYEARGTFQLLARAAYAAGGGDLAALGREARGSRFDRRRRSALAASISRKTRSVKQRRLEGGAFIRAYVLRLIQKWLKAGVLEDGVWAASDKGKPQGATISCLLANIYLHYVYDLWVQQWRKRHATGEVIAVRYADDTVVGFEA